MYKTKAQPLARFFLKVLPCVMLWYLAIILAPRSGLDCRTTSIARWHGRRPSAVTAVVLHRRDRRAGSASYGLVCDSLVDLIYDLAGGLEAA